MSAIAAADADAPSPKKKGGKLKKMLLFGLLPLILIGGGVAAGLHFAGGKGKAAEDPDRPKLVVREGHTAPAGAEPAHPNPALYKATYYPLEGNLTSNMRDSDGIIQIGLGVSTYYDQKVIDRLKDDDMPVRSAILLVLANQDPSTLSTAAGKIALRRQIRDAINQVLIAKEGFGGVDDVYFTSMIVQ